MVAAVDPDPYAHVPKADLCTVKFDTLIERDENELATLMKACERDGFFYLDLQGKTSDKLWKDLDDVGTLTKRWFAQSRDAKLETPSVSLAHG